MKNQLIIQDWTGNTLFEGFYKDPKIDQVLNATRCGCGEGCSECDHSGYVGDFEIYWTDETDKRNVYEFINY